MRTLFVIVAFLGLLLTGLGAYVFRAVNEDNTRITAFRRTQYETAYSYNDASEYKLVWTSDDTVELETISMVIVFAGCILAGIGLIGAVKSSKNVMLPGVGAERQHRAE